MEMVERTDEQGDVVIVVVDRGPSLGIARRWLRFEEKEGEIALLEDI